MNDSDRALLIVVTAWPGVAAIIGGIWSEVKPPSDKSDYLMLVGWPLAIPIFTLYWIFWGITWVGRGPARMIKHLLEKGEIRRETTRQAAKLPSARVV